jgi:hypothetical protein
MRISVYCKCESVLIAELEGREMMIQLLVQNYRKILISWSSLNSFRQVGHIFVLATTCVMQGLQKTWPHIVEFIWMSALFIWVSESRQIGQWYSELDSWASADLDVDGWLPVSWRKNKIQYWNKKGNALILLPLAADEVLVSLWEGREPKLRSENSSLKI